jgi:hypothetical protein
MTLVQESGGFELVQLSLYSCSVLELEAQRSNQRFSGIAYSTLSIGSENRRLPQLYTVPC